LQDLAFELAAYRDGVEHDPAQLEQLRDRQAALQTLQRKYGPSVEDVLDYADGARRRVGELEQGGDRAASLTAEVAELEAEARSVAGQLHDLRTRAAAVVSTAVEEHLADLAMAGARMTVAVEPDELGPHGADRVAFLLAANPGEAPLPLAKAASGGERSRVALAVRLALADADHTPEVLVFDEVDAGIGGATARELGRKLAELARGRPVLCVTHLAQLAAFADVHVEVTKRTDGGRTRAEVRRLNDDERITELSRMLSGTPQSRRATEHAAELRASALDAVKA
jgi:DNA repair protein RecN (Recombination protein N)